MEIEMTEELKEKLKVIEMETKLFSQLPRKPNIFLPIMWSICGICAVISAIFLFRSGNGFNDGNLFLLLFLLAIAASNIVTYFNERRLFDLYSVACKIIDYYKKKEVIKT